MNATHAHTNQVDQAESTQEESAGTNKKTNKEVSNATKEELTKLLLQGLTKIEFAAETVATYVKSGDIKVEDKNTVLDNILQFRMVISYISRDVMMYNEMIEFTRALKIITALQEHVKKAIDNNLQEFPLFDISTVQLKSAVEMHPDEIKDTIKTLKNNIEDITKSAESAGISFFNRAYRFVDSWTIDPIERHGLHTAAFWTVALSATAAYIWFHASKDTTGCTCQKDYTCKNGINTIPKNTVLEYDANGHRVAEASSSFYARFNKIMRQGSDVKIPFTNTKLWHGLGRPRFDSIRQADISDDFLAIQTGKLAALDNFIFSEKGGYLAVGSLYFFPQMKTFYQYYASPKINSLIKKIGDFHAYCKGGIYYKQRRNIPEKAFSINPRFRLKDVIGNKGAVEDARDFVTFALDPEKFLRQDIRPHEGIILTGEPGTGKTHFAEALAGEIQYWLKKNGKNEKDFGFYKIMPSDIQELGFQNIFALMRKWAPCIVFIDELHLARLQDGGDVKSLSEFNQALNGFMNNPDPKRPVIVISATNKPENVSADAKRDGRMGKEIKFNFPTFENRLEFLVKALESRINPKSFDLKKIAHQTDGYAIATLQGVINKALMRTRIECRPLTQKDLEEAVMSEVHKIARHEEVNLSKQEKKALATHMAGHTLARIIFPTQQELSYVTIQPVSEKVQERAVWDQYYKEKEAGQVYGKMFSYYPHDTIGNDSNNQTLRNECKVLLAGRMAEKVVLKSISSNNKRSCSGTCKPNAFNIAKHILLNGLDETQLSKAQKAHLIEATHALLEELEQEVAKVFEEQEAFLIFISEMLIQHKTISQDDILFAINAMVDKAAKDNPELIKELTEEIQKQQASPDSAKQALADELGIVEETAPTA